MKTTINKLSTALVMVFTCGLLFTSCDNTIVEQPKSFDLESDELVLSERINYIDQTLDIFLSPEARSARVVATSPALVLPTMTLTSPVSRSAAFTQVIDGDYTQTLHVNSGETICVTENGNVTGTIALSGGTLVVFGVVDNRSLYGASGVIIVNPTGQFSVPNVSISAGVKLVNYGQMTFADWASIVVDGQFENYSPFTTQAVSVNSGGKLYNESVLTVERSVSIDNLFLNNGTISAENLYVNASGVFVNNCTANINNTMTHNGVLSNSSYINIEEKFYVNSHKGFEMKANSIVEVKEVYINDNITNPDENLSVIYASKKISHNQGSIDDNVMVTKEDNACYIASTSCHEGYGSVPEFSLVAELNPPTVDGDRLSATSVQLVDNMAYVSYHLNGEEYSAAIDVVELNGTGKPKLKQQLMTNDFDFNELKIDDVVTSGNKRKLWVMGAQKMSTSENLTSPAILAEFTIKNKLIEEAGVDYVVDLPGNSGNSVVKRNNTLLTVTGSDGGLQVLNYDDKTVASTSSLDFAKYLNAANGHTVGMTASITGAQLQSYSTDLTSPIVTADLGIITPYDGKLVVHIDGDEAFVACGAMGLKIFDAASLELLASYDPHKGFLNSVETDDDFVYLANGSQGLEILDKRTLVKVGAYKFEGSANFVSVEGDGYIFLANGRGGLKIIKRSN